MEAGVSWRMPAFLDSRHIGRLNVSMQQGNPYLGAFLYK